MKTRFAIVVLIALPMFASGEMRKLDWLTGNWKGEAWTKMGPKTEHVLQSERVRSTVGGNVLIFEGLGKRRLEDGTPGEVVHDALAVVSWDEKAKKYRFDTWSGRTGYAEAWLEAGDHRVVWGFDTPQGGKVRFTITRNDTGQWFEIGEFSRDGNQWQKFFEMTLRKVD